MFFLRRLLPKRYHPLLPTVEEVRANPDIYYSDHLPKLGKINVGGQDLKIITWNVATPNLGSGVDLDDHNQNPESKDQIRRREERIIDAIANMIDKQQPDIIHLQEASQFQNIKNLLKRFPNYRIVQGINGVLSIYNKDKLELESREDIAQKAKESDEVKIGSIFSDRIDLDFKKEGHLRLNFKLAGTPFVQHNLYRTHQDFPARTQAYIRGLQKVQKSHVATFGDTNSRAGHPKDSFQVNNVVGSYWRRFKQQGSDETDAGYETDEKGKVNQIRMQQLDPRTGEIFQLKEIPVFNDPNQERELKRQRPRLCISDSDREIVRAAEKQLSELSDGSINAELARNDFIIGLSSNAYNEQMLSLQCESFSTRKGNKDFAEFLSEYLNMIPGFVVHESGNGLSISFPESMGKSAFSAIQFAVQAYSDPKERAALNKIIHIVNTANALETFEKMRSEDHSLLTRMLTDINLPSKKLDMILNQGAKELKLTEKTKEVYSLVDKIISEFEKKNNRSPTDYEIKRELFRELYIASLMKKKHARPYEVQREMKAKGQEFSIGWLTGRKGEDAANAIRNFSNDELDNIIRRTLEKPEESDSVSKKIAEKLGITDKMIPKPSMKKAKDVAQSKEKALTTDLEDAGKREKEEATPTAKPGQTSS